MKATQANFARLARDAARDAKVFFFCGPDEAGASGAAKAIVDALPDAGERVELSGAQLRAQPSLLGDEARSSSLFGDARHILARVTGDEAHDAVKTLLDTGDMGAGEACPVLIIATAATDKARTAKLLEKRKDALVGMFQLPDLASLAMTVRRMGDAAGVQIDTALAERIAAGAGLDQRLAQAEVTKLALYVDADPQSPKQASGADYDAVGAGIEDNDFAPIVDAVLSGDEARMPGELRRMREVGINAVGVLLALERRAATLARVAARLGPRGQLSSLQFGEKMALGVYKSDEAAIARQTGYWRGARLDRLVERLALLHREMMFDTASAPIRLAQALAAITRRSASRASPR